MATQTTSPSPPSTTRLLRRSLQANGIFSSVSGTSLIAGAAPITSFLGLNSPIVLVVIGALLLLYAASLFVAESAPNVAGAFARFAAVVEEAGTAVLPPEVRMLLHRHLQAWRGEDRGLSRRWVEQSLEGLDQAARAESRLVLLAALAAHQVDEPVIEAFHALHSADSDLVGALALASFAAARRIGTWIACPHV